MTWTSTERRGENCGEHGLRGGRNLERRPASHPCAARAGGVRWCCAADAGPALRGGPAQARRRHSGQWLVRRRGVPRVRTLPRRKRQPRRQRAFRASPRRPLELEPGARPPGHRQRAADDGPGEGQPAAQPRGQGRHAGRLARIQRPQRPVGNPAPADTKRRCGLAGLPSRGSPARTPFAAARAAGALRADRAALVVRLDAARRRVEERARVAGAARGRSGGGDRAGSAPAAGLPSLAGRGVGLPGGLASAGGPRELARAAALRRGVVDRLRPRAASLLHPESRVQEHRRPVPRTPSLEVRRRIAHHERRPRRQAGRAVALPAGPVRSRLTGDERTPARGRSGDPPGDGTPRVRAAAAAFRHHAGRRSVAGCGGRRGGGCGRHARGAARARERDRGEHLRILRRPARAAGTPAPSFARPDRGAADPGTAQPFRGGPLHDGAAARLVDRAGCLA